MRKLSRIVVLVTALASLSAVLSSTAGAVTWTNSGGTGFQATGGAGWLIVAQNALVCDHSAASGTAPMSTTTSTIIAGTVVFSPCVLVGVPTFMHCNYTVTASGLSGGVTSGAADMTCDIRVTASPFYSICHVSGSTPITYTNPSGATPGKLTFLTSTTLVVANGDVACPLNPGTGTWSEQTVNVTTVASSPVFARHP
jgi:hypothetical protein